MEQTDAQLQLHADRIKSAHEALTKHDADGVGLMMTLAKELSDARETLRRTGKGHDKAFGEWLKANGIKLDKNVRYHLIKMASEEDTVRAFLAKPENEGLTNPAYIRHKMRGPKKPKTKAPSNSSGETTSEWVELSEEELKELDEAPELSGEKLMTYLESLVGPREYDAEAAPIDANEAGEVATAVARVAKGFADNDAYRLALALKDDDEFLGSLIDVQEVLEDVIHHRMFTVRARS